MASPFRIFRRHQKIMLAALVLLAMLAFTLSDLFRLGGGGASGTERRGAVDALGKTYSEAELQHLVETRREVHQFLGSLVFVGIRKSNEQGGGLLDEQLLNLQFRQIMPLLVDSEFRRVNTSARGAAIETLILAEKAEQAGIVVSDKAVNEYLDRITDGKVDSAEVIKMIDQMSNREQAFSQATLFKALRVELMATRYLRAFEASIASLTPAQRFNYYKRLHRFASVEMLPISVSDFVDQVKDPTDSQLQAFYEQHRDKVGVPGSPEPGFKRPRKVALQYFRAPVEYFVEKASVTEEEIRDFYEKNKERYIKLELPDDALKPTDDKKSDERKPDDAAKPTDDKQPDAEKPDDAAKPTDDKQPAADKPAGADAAKPDAKAGESPKESAAASGSRTPLKLVSLLPDQPKADAPAESPAKPDDPAKTGSQAEPAKVDAKTEPGKEETKQPAAEPAKQDEATGDKPAEQPGSKTPDEPAAVKPASSELKPREYQSLDSVRAEIRKDLAQDKARKVIDRIFNELQEALAEYRGQRTRLESEQGDVKEYPPFDLKKLAEEKGLGADETSLLSPWALRDAEKLSDKTKVGVSVVQPGPGPQTYPLWAYVFSNNLPGLYRPVRSDGAGDQFLVWKTAETPERVPTLAEVRREVLNAWKLIQARTLAREHAEKLAERARKSKQSLLEEFGKTENKKVLQPAEFTWYTRGNVPGGLDAQLRLSGIEDVEGVNDDFMRSIFSLATLEVGVAVDESQAKQYVIRLKRYRPLEEDLKEAYAGEKFGKYSDAALNDIFRLRQAWVAALEKEAGVEWRTPAQRDEEENSAP